MSMGGSCFSGRRAERGALARGGAARASVKIESQAQPRTQAESVFGHLVLVAGLVDELPEMVIFAAIDRIVAEAPHGIEVHDISRAADDPDLERLAKADGIQEEPCHGGDRKTGTPEGQRGIVFHRQVLIGGRQVAVQGSRDR